MPHRIRAGLLIAVAVAPIALLAVACSRPPEQQFMTQFFRAARARDNTTIAMMSAVDFDSREQGEVVDFTITNITEERRTPLSFKALIEAERTAIAEEAAFRARKLEYQNANLPALEEIVKLEQDPKARFTPAQQKMKAEWDKWREDTTTHQKATAAARAAVTDSTGPAEASLTQPGEPPFNAESFDGELIAKDVSLTAQIRTPTGEEVEKTLVVTLQRVAGTQDGTPREGRAVITRIQGL
ncbi:MAG: hypothetical protein ACT4QD_22295 [Acidobacteriota bacterium]